jgi:hypothetical protein
MKWLLIGFIIVQLAVDLAHSVTAFPFVHYAMFSGSFARPDSLSAFEVTVDDKRLEASDFRVYRWDMVQVPLAGFERQQLTHDFAFDKEKARDYLFGGRSGFVSKTVLPQLDNDDSVTAHFPQWYKQYLSGLLGRPIHNLRVDKTWYRYAGGRLQLLRRKNWINS